MNQQQQQQTVRGFKATNLDMSCLGFKYELGLNHKIEGPIKMCYHGFHFCGELWSTLSYYPMNSRFFEVMGSGQIEYDRKHDKYCASEITLIRELPFWEVYNRLNKNSDGKTFWESGTSGINWNTGLCNTGNHNIGCFNVGKYNNGCYNNGNHIIGSHLTKDGIMS